MAKAKKIEIKITSAVVLDGEIVKPKSKVRVDAKIARNLVARGKAEELDSGAGEDGEKPLDEHTVPELKEIAKEYGVEGADKMKRADLIAAIEAAEAE
ncbi:Rho termination factor N-terminal domain-containing protein [Roseovarius pacificus]|uniref:Rho termination factor N-terminal domain-containing protein n=1 Tax=Roseovarius pacificus TaxID=337701 RepID=UPI002A18BB74|nr:Rho termination factor N-terminal domain-containing protein [Roseovarius pacificus]